MGTVDVAVALAGNAMCVQVSDNGIGIGIGIASERLTDILKLYARVDHDDAKPQEGIGVDLSLAFDLARSDGCTAQALSIALATVAALKSCCRSCR